MIFLIFLIKYVKFKYEKKNTKQPTWNKRNKIL